MNARVDHALFEHLVRSEFVGVADLDDEDVALAFGDDFLASPIAFGGDDGLLSGVEGNVSASAVVRFAEDPCA